MVGAGKGVRVAVRVALVAAVALGAAGCNRVEGPEAWRTEADCTALEDPARRDDCYAQVAVGVFRASTERGEALLEAVGSPLVRDYILLAVTREVEPTTFRWCERIENEVLAERCRSFVHRPHLHRELDRGPRQGGAAPR